MIDIHSAAKALGGHVHGGKIHAPAPNHSKRDRSLIVSFNPNAPDGFSVHGFAGEPWQELKDYVRERLGIEAWKPTRGRDDNGPVFVAKSYVYRDQHGHEYHRIDHLSDGSTRPHYWNVDGWERGLGDRAPIPFDLPDLIDAPEVWLVFGEANAELLCGGFGVVATTYPTIDEQEPDASFLFHLRDKTVHVLDAGSARGGVFARKFAKAIDVPVVKLPEGVRTLREFAQDQDADISALVIAGDYVHESEAPETSIEEPETVRRIKRTKFTPIDIKSIAPREWIYGTHLIRRYVSLTAAPGGLGKTSLGMVDAMAVALGQPLYPDMHIHGDRPRNVWYWNGEDPQDENLRRTAAAIIGFGIDQDKLSETFAIDSGRDMPMRLCKMARGDAEIDEELFEELEQSLIEDNVEALFLDPLVSIHEANENDNGAMGMLIKRLSLVAQRANCAIEIVHHVRKPSQGHAAATSVNDARGAGALLGGVRSARVLNVMDKETADLCGFSEEERFSCVAISDGEKSNMSAKKGSQLWRRIEGVALENGTPEYPRGDNVAVVKYFELPETAAAHLDMSTAHEIVESILKRDTTTRPKQDGKRAPDDWLGYKLLGKLGGEIKNKEHLNAIERFLKNREKDGDIVRRSAKGEYGRKNEYYALPWQVESDNVVPITSRPETDDDKPFF